MNFIKSSSILRQTLKGTKYLLANPQVGAFALTAKDIVSWSSIVKGTKITILISSVFSLIDYFTTKDGKADFTDIAVNLLTGIGKALVAYWVGTVGALAVIGIASAFTIFGATVAAPAFAVFAVGALVSIGIGIFLNSKDDEYGWTTSLQNKINELQESFNKKIEQIEEDVENNKSASTFSKLEYLKILFADAEIQLIPNLIEFLNINPATLQGAGNPLWNILYKILQHNIAYYDNTYAKPDIQFENSFLKDKITNINVTNDDIYSSKKESKNYYEFIKYIEEIEERYEKNKTQFNLLDLLFTLIANDKKAKTLLNTLPSIINKIDIVEYIVTGEADRRLKLLRKLLTNIKIVFDVRSFEELEDSSQKLILEQEENNKDRNPYNDTLKRGSLMYFLIETHSTSRRKLHPKVKEFLKRLGAKR